MDNGLLIKGDLIYLRPVNEDDLSGNYMKWLNDKEVTRFMAFGNSPITLERMKDYLNKLRNDNNLLLAVIIADDDQYVGNIRIGPIDEYNKRSDIGIMVGDRSVWGKGIASSAMRLALDYSFHVLDLSKITLGVISGNVKAIKLFESLGFAREGCLRSHSLCNGVYQDVLLYGLMAEEFKKRNS
jgi:RimJ/RimL family protein N-acetyltransferase|tara:strand:- start:682 stop:1233 length:552 start_codon:yes stop_codon:yes gene_type:complete